MLNSKQRAELPNAVNLIPVNLVGAKNKPTPPKRCIHGMMLNCGEIPVLKLWEAWSPPIVGVYFHTKC